MSSKHWHVLYTKPRNEKKAVERLTKKGYEVYCPLIKTLRQWSDRKKKVQVPMFPGYIFALTNDAERQQILMDPGVLNYVYWLGKPAIVRDEEMKAIQRIAEAGEDIHVTGSGFEKGQFVKIPEGPFKGMNGIVDKIDKRKVLVFVEQLDCIVSFRYVMDSNE